MKPLPLIRVKNKYQGISVTFAEPHPVHGEYIKDVYSATRVVSDGVYRVSIARLRGRFSFKRERHPEYTHLVYQLYDRKTCVWRPAGGYWCASVVRLFGVARKRFNLVRVSA